MLLNLPEHWLAMTRAMRTAAAKAAAASIFFISSLPFAHAEGSITLRIPLKLEDLSSQIESVHYRCGIKAEAAVGLASDPAYSTTAAGQGALYPEPGVRYFPDASDDADSKAEFMRSGSYQITNKFGNVDTFITCQFPTHLFKLGALHQSGEFYANMDSMRDKDGKKIWSRYAANTDDEYKDTEYIQSYTGRVTGPIVADESAVKGFFSKDKGAESAELKSPPKLRLQR